jgi:hypothetical protein
MGLGQQRRMHKNLQPNRSREAEKPEASSPPYLPELPVARRDQHRQQVGVQPRHEALALGVAEAHVVLEELGLGGCLGVGVCGWGWGCWGEGCWGKMGGWGEKMGGLARPHPLPTLPFLIMRPAKSTPLKGMPSDTMALAVRYTISSITWGGGDWMDAHLFKAWSAMVETLACSPEGLATHPQKPNQGIQAHLRLDLRRHHRRRRVGAHAARVGPGVAVPHRLVVLRRRQGNGRLPVQQREEGGLLAVKKLLDDDHVAWREGVGVVIGGGWSLVRGRGGWAGCFSGARWFPLSAAASETADPPDQPTDQTQEHPPASPNALPSSIESTASHASSTVAATMTPLPAARPEALTTMGAPCWRMYFFAAAGWGGGRGWG